MNDEYNEEKKELEQFDLSLKKKKKKKVKEIDDKNDKNDSSSEIEYDYDYVYLLDRIFTNIRENNPSLQIHKKIVIPPPQLVGLSKKTMICNFSSILEIINRSIEHVKSYFISELNTNCNIDSMNRMIIKGKFIQRQIESIFKKYITEYVICDSCKKLDTILIKDQITRIYFLKCNVCNSTRSVQVIKNGFSHL